MKNLVYISTIFLIALSFSCKQKQQTTHSTDNQQALIDSLTNKVSQNWIRENPSFGSTKTSFFNQSNENSYYVGLLQISGESIPFMWDDNLSLLQFMLSLNNETKVKQGIDADPNYLGTKIVWNKGIDGLIWFNNKSYKATVANWHLGDSSECPGTINFPSLYFEKVVDVSNATANNIQGITILPYVENLVIKSTETELQTNSGQHIKGVAFDINKDNIVDIFTYTEVIDETTNYTRLYLNVSGQWKCKWINLDEACI